MLPNTAWKSISSASFGLASPTMSTPGQVGSSFLLRPRRLARRRLYSPLLLFFRDTFRGRCFLGGGLPPPVPYRKDDDSAAVVYGEFCSVEDTTRTDQ
jgi:hypothetical protein